MGTGPDMALGGLILHRHVVEVVLPYVVLGAGAVQGNPAPAAMLAVTALGSGLGPEARIHWLVVHGQTSHPDWPTGPISWLQPTLFESLSAVQFARPDRLRGSGKSAGSGVFLAGDGRDFTRGPSSPKLER